MDTFYLLNNKVQKVIYDMGWREFKPIQDEAICHMIKSPSDMIISAPTASGKTEAAFLPIISNIIDSKNKSVKILYISPLKALINDQMLRVEKLCKYLNFPITKWHGDANQTKKKYLMKSPDGILLTTPESIQALFINKIDTLINLIRNLEYIVIDEIHSFIGNERGTQLKCLLNRIYSIIDTNPYKIALSATISNIDDIAKWLNEKDPSSVKIIKDDSKKSLKGIIKFYPSGNFSKNTLKEIKSSIQSDRNLILANTLTKLNEYYKVLSKNEKESEEKRLDDTNNIDNQDNNLKKHSQMFIVNETLNDKLIQYYENLLSKNQNLTLFLIDDSQLNLNLNLFDKIIFLEKPNNLNNKFIEKNLSNNTQFIDITNNTKIRLNIATIDLTGINKEFKNSYQKFINSISKSLLSLYNEVNYSNFENDLIRTTYTKKNLIFANSKNVLEKNCFLTKGIAKEYHLDINYMIHHGSLGKDIRENCEEALKKSENISVYCTSTLELGIDIGDINRVIFLDVPFSVSSLDQRIGRSGRRGESYQEFHFLLTANAKDNPESNPLYLDLVRCIAMIECKQEGFKEPLDTHYLDYSTLIQQILAYLAQTGACTKNQLFKNVIKIGFNNSILKEDFVDIVKNLIMNEIIYKISEDKIALTNKGERITQRLDFYCAFDTLDTYKVVNEDGEIIGDIPEKSLDKIKNNKYFILNGISWALEEIKHEKRIILVTKTNVEALINFQGSGQFINRKIYATMQDIYETKFIPKYLSKKSIPFLKTAFENYDIRFNKKNKNILKTFKGEKVQRTLGLIFDFLKIEYKNLIIGYELKNINTVILKLKNFEFTDENILELLNTIPSEIKEHGKYDNLLPIKQLNKSFISHELDLVETKKYIDEL